MGREAACKIRERKRREESDVGYDAASTAAISCKRRKRRRRGRRDEQERW